jgi:ankyrin repeat protein
MHGSTTLSMAAMKGYSNMITFLVEKGVYVDTADNNGRTPLMIAVTHGHIKTVNTLLESGAKIWAQDNYGWTAVHFATRQLGGHEIYRPVLDTLLAAAAANTSVLDIPDKDGRTALMYAVLQSTDYALTALLSAGADPTKQDVGGATAYGMAVNSEFIRRQLAEASAEWAVRAHDEWERSEKLRKLKNKKNKQCSLNP